jgi:integrase
MSVPEPNLADLLHLVAATDMSATRQRDMSSALRTAARALGAAPGDIPLNIKLLRRRLEEVSPESIGLSQARWNNVRALVNRGLELKLTLMPSAQQVPISEAWRQLKESLPRSSWYRMSALLRFLSSRDVGPATVTLSDLDAFRDGIIEHRLRANAEDTWNGVSWCWNKCVAEIAGWPQITIPREDRRTVYVQPWSAFPTSLEADVQAYLKILSGAVLDEKGPKRKLRASTLRNREYQFRAAASALAASGLPAAEIRGLADLARLEPFKRLLQQVLDRGEYEPRAAAFNIGNALRAAAKYYVQIDEVELEKISKILAQLRPKQAGLTSKNRARLLPFNDPEIVKRFLSLPFELADELKAKPRRNVVDAAAAQAAVAIAILQAVPLRVANLAALDLAEHLSERGGRVFISLQGHEAKNAAPIEMELPPDVADLIAWYCLNYRDLLVNQPNTSLFPGEGAGPKQAQTLARQITARVKARLGLDVNVHLFRHLAAKLYLDRKPGEYATVSLLLGHQSVTTTMRAYCGTETVTAARHFQSVVAGLRDRHPGRRRLAR